MLAGNLSGRKIRCTNCPARNRRVRDYSYVSKAGVLLDQRILCEECNRIMRRILTEEAREQKAA
jgi:hypothetical protein